MKRTGNNIFKTGHHLVNIFLLAMKKNCLTGPDIKTAGDSFQKLFRFLSLISTLNFSCLERRMLYLGSLSPITLLNRMRYAARANAPLMLQKGKNINKEFSDRNEKTFESSNYENSLIICKQKKVFYQLINE